MTIDGVRLNQFAGFLGAVGQRAGGLVLLIAVTFVVLRLVEGLLRGLVGALLDREAQEGTAQELSSIEVQKRKATLEGLAGTTARALILLIAFIMALGVLGLDVAPAIAGLGVVGVAVGFGAQSLVRDYLAGVFILIENHYAKGDVVNIAGVAGTVEDFTLRRTTLRDLDGTVHTIPNGLIGVSSNLTRVWARVNLDVLVGYGSDIDRVTDVVNGVGKDMARDPAWKRRVLEAAHVERVEGLGESGITLKILGSVRAADRWSAAGELRKRILAAFAEHGIAVPGPQGVFVTPSTGTGGGPSDEELAQGAD